MLWAIVQTYQADDELKRRLYAVLYKLASLPIETRWPIAARVQREIPRIADEVMQKYVPLMKAA